MRDRWWWLLVALGVLLLRNRTAPASGGVFDPDADDMTIGFLPSVRDFASAIAHAEGFGIVGAVPTRAHNPGDIKFPGAQYKTGNEGITVFPDDMTGWMHLYQQVDRMRRGTSQVYSPSWSIQQVADRWTDTAADSWAANVVSWLRGHGYDVNPDTALSEFLV